MKPMFVVFHHRKIQYRAKLKNKILIALCKRLSPYYGWRKVSNVEVAPVWLAFTNKNAQALANLGEGETLAVVDA